MPDIYLHEHTVHAGEIDPLGHANNVSFVHWMQEAAIAHSTAQGWPMSGYRDIGMAWVVRRHTIEYLFPAFEGDRIVVRTWVADMQRVTSLRRYEISAGGRLLARAETSWAFIRTADGKLTRVPDVVSRSFILVPDGVVTGRL
jgi:acyl-CoA thioester hydrolase